MGDGELDSTLAGKNRDISERLSAMSVYLE